MFELIKTETVPLTRELAMEFNEMTPSPVEREVKKQRVDHLRTKADAGHLVPFNWARVQLPGGEILRMNGQHSSTMLVSLEGDFPNNLFAHIDTFKVDDEDGMALLFRQFDDRKSGRSPTDVSGAYQKLQKNLRDVPAGTAKLAIEAICWQLKYVVGAPSPIGDDRYQLFRNKNYHEFINYIGELIGMKQPEMKNEGLVAAIYATFELNNEAAREFWNLVSRGGDEHDEDDATAVLSCWLQSARDIKTSPKPRPGVYYNTAIHAWNSFRANSDCKISNRKIKAATDKGWYEPST